MQHIAEPRTTKGKAYCKSLPVLVADVASTCTLPSFQLIKINRYCHASDVDLYGKWHNSTHMRALFLTLGACFVRRVAILLASDPTLATLDIHAAATLCPATRGRPPTSSLTVVPIRCCDVTSHGIAERDRKGEKTNRSQGKNLDKQTRAYCNSTESRPHNVKGTPPLPSQGRLNDGRHGQARAAETAKRRTEVSASGQGRRCCRGWLQHLTG